MTSHFYKSYNTNNGSLHLLAISKDGDNIDTDLVEDIVTDEIDRLAPYIIDPEQILYIRNNDILCIDGIYPAGHTYFPNESMIAVPRWQNISPTELRAVVAHELHHMARWQNVGYGDTLGGAIASDGIATYYEEIRSGRKPLWAKTKVSETVRIEAHRHWDDTGYDHNEWFFDGPYGRWVGYSLGYELAKNTLNPFNVGQSVKIAPKDLLG